MLCLESALNNGHDDESQAGIQPPNLSISETVGEVIVHHTDRLHVRINDGRTSEAESPVFEILAKGVRLTRGRRNLPHCLPPVKFGSSIDSNRQQ